MSSLALLNWPTAFALVVLGAMLFIVVLVHIVETHKTQREKLEREIEFNRRNE